MALTDCNRDQIHSGENFRANISNPGKFLNLAGLTQHPLYAAGILYDPFLTLQGLPSRALTEAELFCASRLFHRSRI